ncbi:MAG: nuclear transport factor 2 family protein [Acidimicrobiia bacterium]
MADTPEETIKAAAAAYIAGQGDRLSAELSGDVRVLGSHRPDVWEGADAALEGLAPELRVHEAGEGISGSLVNFDEYPVEVVPVGDTIAYSSRTGDLDIGGEHHDVASWTTVLRLEKDWKIVHSHFSIHH